MNNEQCSFPTCKGYCYLLYINRPICQSHWDQICEADGETEKGLLKRINLVRDASGTVVTIGDNKNE